MVISILWFIVKRGTVFLNMFRHVCHFRYFLSSCYSNHSRSREAALDQEIKSKGKQLDDTTRNIRQIKQTLMRNESDLSAANLDEIKDELKGVEETIIAEEGKLDVKKVNHSVESLAVI